MDLLRSFISSFLAALLLGRSHRRVLTEYYHIHREVLWPWLRFIDLMSVDGSSPAHLSVVLITEQA